MSMRGARSTTPTGHEQAHAVEDTTDVVPEPGRASPSVSAADFQAFLQLDNSRYAVYLQMGAQLEGVAVNLADCVEQWFLDAKKNLGCAAVVHDEKNTGLFVMPLNGAASRSITTQVKTWLARANCRLVMPHHFTRRITDSH